MESSGGGSDDGDPVRIDFSYGLAKAGVQVCKESGHLCFVEAAIKCGHHALPVRNHLAHLYVGGGRTTGKLRSCEDVVKAGRHLFQFQIVLFVAMSATRLVEMLPFPPPEA